jgi:hypothetical protein
MFLPLTYAEDTNTPDIAVTLDPFELQHNNWFNLEMENQKKIRLERLKICENAFLQSELELSDIYGQLPVVRCATFATLVYAYESNY